MMRTILGAAIAAILSTPAAAIAADSAEMAEVRRMIEQMKAEHEQQIKALEQRLKAAEQKAETAAKAAETAAETAEIAQQASTQATAKQKQDSMGTVTSGTSFNPQLSVILDGNYYHDSVDGEGTGLLSSADGINRVHGGGHDHGDDDHGHAHGGAEQGFNFRSAEFVFSATVDNYFDARAMVAINSDGDVDIEEAWFQTRSLPYGLKIKGGKFLSDIGYANNQHPHQWDFTDQNLAYLNLLGDHGLQDTGLQATWLPDWDHYTLFGVEVLQGDQEYLGTGVDISDSLAHELEEEGFDLGLGDRDDAPQLLTTFTKYSPDLGFDHALQIGLWGAWTDQHQELHGALAHEDEHDHEEEHDHEDEHEEEAHTPLHALDGDAWMWGVDLVYKYDSARSYGAGDFKLQAEYLRMYKDLELTFHEEDPSLVGDDRDFTEDGFYVQGLYGIAPRWQVGLRYDSVGMTNKLESGSNTLREWDSSDRWTAALTWIPTEYSLLRLQYSMADISIDGESNDFDYLYLQYVFSLGSHGAHKF
jgi:hypothetical protein